MQPLIYRILTVRTGYSSTGSIFFTWHVTTPQPNKNNNMTGYEQSGPDPDLNGPIPDWTGLFNISTLGSVSFPHHFQPEYVPLYLYAKEGPPIALYQGRK